MTCVLTLSLEKYYLNNCKSLLKPVHSRTLKTKSVWDRGTTPPIPQAYFSMFTKLNTIKIITNDCAELYPDAQLLLIGSVFKISDNLLKTLSVVMEMLCRTKLRIVFLDKNVWEAMN